MAFIDDHKQRFGVEPICRMLSEHGMPIVPNGYHAARSRPPSVQALRDAELGEQSTPTRSWAGACKVWQQLRREGVEVARCTVKRLIRTAGLRRVAADPWSPRRPTGPRCGRRT